MKQYQYVTVAESDIKSAKRHRSVIDNHAAAGWRYVGLIPTEHSNDGRVTKMDLVFERDA